MRKMLFLLSFIWMSAVSFATVAEPLDKVVAVVNSSVITQSELSGQMKIVRSQMQAAGAPIPPEAALRKMVLNQLIDNALQLGLAKKAGLKVTDAEVDGVIAKIAAENHLSVDALYQGVASQGMGKATYREQIRQQMIIHTIQQKVLGSEVKVTSQDLANAENFSNSARTSSQVSYSQYHVVDIVLPTQDKADNFLTQLKAGATAESLMKKNPDAKVEDLGMRPLSGLPSIFQRPVQALKQGQFSAIIQAPNGYHILQLVDVAGKKVVGPSAPPMTASQLAFQHKYNEALQQWLQKLRSQSYVKIMNDD